MAVKLLRPSDSCHTLLKPQFSSTNTSLKGCTQSLSKGFLSHSNYVASCQIRNPLKSATNRTGGTNNYLQKSVRSHLGDCIGGRKVRFVGEKTDLGYQAPLISGFRRAGIDHSLPAFGRAVPLGICRAASLTGASAGLASESDAGLSVLAETEGVDNVPSLEEVEVSAESWEENGAPRGPLRRKKKKNVAEIWAAASGESLPQKKTKLKKKKSKPNGAGKTGKANKVSQGLNQGLRKPEGLESLEELSVEALLRRGWKLLELGSAKSAAEYFGECVGRGAERGDKVTALLGLAEALCAQTSYDSALAAISIALDLDPANPEALFRAGTTCLHLERFAEARSHLASARASSPKPSLATKVDQALQDIERCEKQSQGAFDLESFHTEQRIPTPMADYIGPVEISDLVGKGRGLTVTRDVKRGELLVAAKAVAVSSREGRAAGREVDTSAQDAQVAQMVLERVCADLWVRTQVESMYDGTDRKLSVPSIDIFRRNAYRPKPEESELGGNLTPASGAPEGGSEGKGAVSTELDLERIKRVKLYNAFSTEAVQGISGEEGPSEMDEVGLWTLAGIINHSCLPSASYFVIGDAHFVFAVQDLPRGAEVTQPYMAVAEPRVKRQRDARLLWRFSCRCSRCEFEESRKDELESATATWQEVREATEVLRRAEEEGGAAAEEAFRFFRSRLDSVEAVIEKVGRTEEERNWLRASYMTCYTRFERVCELVGDWEACERAGLACLDAMESVNLYFSFTIQHAAEIAELMLCRYGKESEEWRAYKQRMLRIVERSLNCVPRYAVEAIEDIESFSRGECRELFSEKICRW